MIRRRLVFSLSIGAAVPLLWLGGCKCEKDQPPPPLPPQTTPDAAAPLELVDAGPDVSDAADADADAKPKTAAQPSASLRKCCTALAQNAENAPEPTKSYLKLAAASCHAGIAQGKDKASVIAIVTGALRGAGLPADCK